MDGYFTVELDFKDANAFNGEARWLQIGVRPGGSTGGFTTLSPRQEVTPAPYALALPGVRTQQNATSANIISGYSGNSIKTEVVGATIGGGGDSIYPNKVTDDYGIVAGGTDNQAGDDGGTTFDGRYATVGGGHSNTASGAYGTVGGGQLNLASGGVSTVCGGWSNKASNLNATVSGGRENNASGNYATIGGGGLNFASGNDATIPGGRDNAAGGYYSFAAGRRAKANHDGSFVWADSDDMAPEGLGDDFASTANDQFLIRASGGVGIGTNRPNEKLTIEGALSLDKISAPSATFGYGKLYVKSTDSKLYFKDDIGTEYDLTAGFGYDSDWTISGSDMYTGAGVTGNVGIGTESPAAKLTVNGAILRDGSTMYGSNADTHINLGTSSYTGTNGQDYSFATVSGGYGNEASGVSAVVGGGYFNTASGDYASVPGGRNNDASGDDSFAAGRRARANHNGTFVWADSINQEFHSTDNNQFLIRASGGVGIGTSSPSASSQLHVKNSTKAVGGLFETSRISSDTNALQVQAETSNTGDNRGIFISASNSGSGDAYSIYSTNSEGMMYHAGKVGIGSGITSPTAKLDVNGPTGYDQLRLRTSFTPTDTSDSHGNVGDIAWDDSYIYVKTSAGWKRTALSTF
jgi:hypothetical protein